LLSIVSNIHIILPLRLPTIKDVSLFLCNLKPNQITTMDSCYVFVILGMAAQYAFFQTAIKKNAIFPAGTRVKRDGNNLLFGATFRELLPEVRNAMNKFIYKLGKDLQIQLDTSQTEFVKKNVKFNTQKNKHLEWIMPIDSKGIVYTVTHDADKHMLVIGAFSYLHRLNAEMIGDADYYKQELLTAFDTEDKELLAQTKRNIRKADWPSCFDGIVFEAESSSSEDVAPEPEKVHEAAPIGIVATVTTKRPSVTFENGLETIHEITPEEEDVSASASNPAIAHLELKFCWVCDKTMNVCKC